MLNPLRPDPANIQIELRLEIRGEEIGELNRLADRAVELAGNIPGAVDVDKDWRVGKPEIWVTPDRERAAEFGISVGQISRVLRASLTGDVASYGQKAKRGKIVGEVKASGAGSLCFEIPSNSPADTSGSFWLNFKDDLSAQFGEGEEFYVQWRQRFSPQFW